MASRPKLRVAIAGAGMVSRHHLIAWSRNPDAEIVAIADPKLEIAERRAQEFGIPRTYPDAARMLDCEALDIASAMSEFKTPPKPTLWSLLGLSAR